MACGREFVPGHEQFSELMPLNIDAMEHSIREAAAMEKVGKSKRTRQPNRRAKTKTSLVRT